MATIIIEIRSGAGGSEAKLWQEDLLRMYSKYAISQGWQVKKLETGKIRIKGEGAYRFLKNESGVHRVQRVPATEKRGRIHTSTASVVVLQSEKENEIKFNPADLKVEFYCSGGHGGQNVNKVATAVRIRHKPTGLVVTSQKERRQYQNRQIATAMLKEKLLRRKNEKETGAVNETRREAIGAAERAEKIRTYNFPQNRVTDHRINKSWQNLESVIAGDLRRIVKILEKKLG